MASTRAIFITYLAVIATGLILHSTIGLLRGSDQRGARDVALAFTEALQNGNGDRACDLLAPRTRSAIEEQRKKSCDQAIVEVREDLAVHGRLGPADVAETSAIVTTDEGDALFLDERQDGWHVGAAGCTRQAGDAPYDCALEG